MSTLYATITDDPIDLGMALITAADVTTPLANGTTYTIQNIGSNDVYLHVGAAAPDDLDGPWMVLAHQWRQSGTDAMLLSYDGEAIWARTRQRASSIAVTEAS